MSKRPAFSLVEVITLLAVLAIALLVALPPYRALADRLAVDGATSGLVRALADARSSALRSSTRYAVRADTASASLRVYSVFDSTTLPLGALFGTSLSATRDSIAYSGTGLGYGAANVRYIVSRGSSAETVTVSRAGRVRR